MVGIHKHTLNVRLSPKIQIWTKSGNACKCNLIREKKTKKTQTLRPPYWPGGFCVAKSINLGWALTVSCVSGMNSSRLSSRTWHGTKEHIEKYTRIFKEHKFVHIDSNSSPVKPLWVWDTHKENTYISKAQIHNTYWFKTQRCQTSMGTG